jgi:hypothetical protein
MAQGKYIECATFIKLGCESTQTPFLRTRISIQVERLVLRKRTIYNDHPNIVTPLRASKQALCASSTMTRPSTYVHLIRLCLSTHRPLILRSMFMIVTLDKQRLLPTIIILPQIRIPIHDAQEELNRQLVLKLRTLIEGELLAADRTITVAIDEQVENAAVMRDVCEGEDDLGQPRRSEIVLDVLVVDDHEELSGAETLGDDPGLEAQQVHLEVELQERYVGEMLQPVLHGLGQRAGVKPAEEDVEGTR